VARVLADLELTAVSSSFVGPFGTIGSERELVAQAWDLAEVEQAYEGFLHAFAGAAGPTRDVLSNQIHLVHAWRRFPFLDPKLPAELLPDRWAGARAAGVFDQLHSSWADQAQLEWDELVAEARPH
jgi:phenylacetic acid degradation operon negative regulatory protein